MYKFALECVLFPMDKEMQETFIIFLCQSFAMLSVLCLKMIKMKKKYQ